jgi:hypothetical protein
MAKKISLGSIFEIPLTAKKFAYGCLFENLVIGIYDVISDERLSIEIITKMPFKAFMACSDSAIKKGIWPLIGIVSLMGDERYAPDRAFFAEWLPKDSIEKSEINRRGKRVKVPEDYYLSLVKSGMISAAFDKPEAMVRWIVDHLERWPDYDVPED